MLRCLSVILAFFVLLSCSSTETVDSSKIVEDKVVYQDFFMFVYGNTKKVSMNVQFRIDRKDGDTIKLEDPSEVKANGEIMQENDANKKDVNIIGTYYRTQFDLTDDLKEITIAYKTREDKTFTNKLPVPTSVTVKNPVEKAKLSLKEDQVITFDGTIEKDETLRCYLDSDAENYKDGKEGAGFISGKSLEGETSCRFLKEDLAKFKVGKAYIYFVRTSENRKLTDVTPVGGDYYTKYYSPKVEVEMVEESAQESTDEKTE